MSSYEKIFQLILKKIKNKQIKNFFLIVITGIKIEIINGTICSRRPSLNLVFKK